MQINAEKIKTKFVTKQNFKNFIIDSRSVIVDIKKEPRTKMCSKGINMIEKQEYKYKSV